MKPARHRRHDQPEAAALAFSFIGEHGQVAWSDEIDLCPDALYLRLTDKAPEEVFPNLRKMRVDA